MQTAILKPARLWSELRAQRASSLPLDLIVIAAFVLFVGFRLGFSPRVFFDGDVSWHLASGQWILSHHQVPMRDPFSYTRYGHPWIAHEWLSSIPMTLAYNAFGYSGIAFLIASAIAATLLIIGLYVRRWADPVELAVTLLTVVLVLNPFTLARPMVLVWPMLAFWVSALLRAREEGCAPSWWLVLMMALWVNLHASFVVGLGLVAVFAFEALLESVDKRRVIIEWGSFGIACGLASLLNPHGLTGVLLPLGVFTSTTTNLVREFKPTDFTAMPRFEFALLLMVGVAFLRGARLAPVRLVLILGMLHMAIAHMRHQTLFILVSALVVAPVLTKTWIAGRTANPGLRDTIRAVEDRKGLAIMAAIAVAAWAGILMLAAPVNPPVSAVNPVKAFSAIPAELRNKPVLNEYSFGGPLILHGIKVYMDGRTDVYGDRYFEEYMHVWKGEPAAFARAYNKWHFCWSIFPPDNKELVALLDRTPGWKRIYSDKFAIIHVREACTSQQ
ncbi:MAG: hypothetical protein ABIQ32_00925 [Sphingomicrobium sp.]